MAINIKEAIGEQNFPERSFVVVGSGILQTLGIRDSQDIDLVVSRELYGQLEDRGWQKKQLEDHEGLALDVFEAWSTWMGDEFEKVLDRSVIIDDIPYTSLNELRAWKAAHARPKDLQDIELIDTYLAENER